MATKVGPWLVSTVGEYIHPRNSGANERSEEEYLRDNPKGEEIGIGRHYETMVFKAGVECSCGCGLPTIDGSEQDFIGAETAKEAAEAHRKLCLKYSRIKPT